MTEARFQRLQALFDACLALPESEQEAFAIRSCGPDGSLRDELLDLLRCQRSEPLIADGGMLPGLDAALRAALPDAFAAPRRAGPFRLIEALGDGGMGRVYLARRDDGEVEQEVAIKLVRTELLSPALLARFSLERRLLAALNHPNICRFLDAGTLPDGTPYVAMERVRGEPLLDYCARRRLDLAARVRLLRKIADAVAHAHRQLIVHRDIKSGNVLVDDRGEPKLLDFGIATLLDDGERMRRTLTADRFLTPANAAPEQLRGEPAGVGCDVHALGLLGYELLCGHAAFDLRGLRAGQIEHLLLHVPPPPMSQRAATGDVAIARERGFDSTRALAKALRNDLDAVIATCLRKTPQERYPHVEQLDAEFERWLQQRPVRARGGDRGYRLRKYVERHRVPVALGLALAATLVAGVVATGWQALRLADERNRALLERDRAQQVVTLLQDAFVAADPARAAGEQVRARDILAAARPRIEALHASRPDLYVALAATLAEVQLGLSLDRDAFELAARALQTALGHDVPVALQRTLWRVQAEAAIRLEDHVPARRALAAMAALDATTQPDWLVAQAQLLREEGRTDAALEALSRARSMLEAQGPEHELATRARWETVRVLRQAERFDAALGELDATLRWQRPVLPEAHARVALTRLQRIDLLRQSGDYAGAASDAETVHRDVIGAYGERSPMAARSGAAFGLALYYADRIDRGVAVYREARDAWLHTLGADHPETVRATFNLASMVEMLPGHEGEARRMFESALEGTIARDGPDSNRSVYMRLRLAQLLGRQDQWPEVLARLTAPEAARGIASAMATNRQDYASLLRTAAEKAGCPATHPACGEATNLLARLDPDPD